jgi:preprotein translocase subunit SecD
MEKKRAWRLILIGLVVVFCALYVLPTFIGAKAMPEWYPFSKTLNYGLDLKGGLELRYGVDYKKAVMENVRDLMFRLETHIVTKVNDKEPGYKPTEADLVSIRKRVSMEVATFDALTVRVTDDAVAAYLTGSYLKDNVDDRFSREDGPDGAIILRMKDDNIEGIKKQVVDQTLSIIRKRIDAFGLIEPDVRKNGDTNIDIQIPGVSGAQMDMVREKIGQTARLTFRILDSKSDFFATVVPDLEAFKKANPERSKGIEVTKEDGKTQLKSAKKSELVGFMRYLRTKKKIPQDHAIGYWEVEKTGPTGAVEQVYYKTEYLFGEVKVSGDHLTRAQVFYQQSGEPYVSLEFNNQGAKLFEEVTTDHVKEYMAVMLDDDINSAPQIKEAISGGRAQITLGGSRSPQELLQEAQSLVTVLTHGAYKAPVHKIHDHQVGPSLGKDTINAGVVSFAVGSILVLLFMLVYYQGAGVIANIAILMNVLFMLTILITMNSALTLPGIAGIILTVGMAVDANVIIYERIREEVRLGKSPRVAIEHGYAKAFWTIMDAQVTTALAAIILLNFTSGPIYGFAVTLLIGIICSIITSLYITKLIFFWLLDKRIIAKRISI